MRNSKSNAGLRHKPAAKPERRPISEVAAEWQRFYEEAEDYGTNSPALIGEFVCSFFAGDPNPVVEVVRECVDWLHGLYGVRLRVCSEKRIIRLPNRDTVRVVSSPEKKKGAAE